MKRFSAIAASLLLFATGLFAQNSILVDAPNLISSDEQFNVTFVVEGENSPSSFEWDPGQDFQLVWGPQKGSSTSISIINGKKTKSSQTTYTYILLPKKTGKFTLPSALATVKGEQIRSQAKAIEVVSGAASSSSTSSSSSSSSSSGNGAGASSQTGDISSSDIFLKLALSRNSVVVGEPITATLKLYQRVNIAGFEDARFPTFNGFWSQEVLTPTNIEFNRENVNGNLYNAAILRSWVIIPQQAGNIAIDPAELVCLVNVRTQSAPRSVFDSFFDDDIRTIRKRVTTEAHTIKVTPLPAGAPASFGGGVGSFTISASLSRDSLKAHDAASLFVTLSGKGNVTLLEAPKVALPPDFEHYDVKITDNVDKSAGKTSGSRTFEYPFIPRSHGEFVIEPVRYAYYDVNAHKYVTLQTAPMSIKVGKGEGADTVPGGTVVVQPRGRDVKDLGNDVRFIRTKLPSFRENDSSFFASALFWILFALLLVGGAAVYVAFNKVTARRADVVGTRNRGATKMARKRLAKAGEYLEQNQYSAFYEELHRALIGFISDKLNIDMADMSKENVEAALGANGVPSALNARFVSLLGDCEFARYSPDPGHDAMNAHYEDALGLISEIDSTMKKKTVSGKGAATLLILMLLLPSTLVNATTDYPDSLWNAGVAAYSDGRWSEALEDWQAIETLGLESVDLYYNLGNASYKTGDNARAIVYYERGLKLDPSNEDLRVNLEYVNSFNLDKIDVVPEFFLKTWLRNACRMMSEDAWSVLFLILTALTIACVLFFLLCARSSLLRKLGFYLGIVMLLCALMAFGFAKAQKDNMQSSDTAIVVKAVSSVKSSPSNDMSKDLFILHEGTKLRLLDSVGEWKNVSLYDGRQGWIRESDIEVI